MKTKRYWLRVGLVFVGLYLIPAVIVYINLISLPTPKCVSGISPAECGLDALEYIIVLGLPSILLLLPLSFVDSGMSYWPAISNNSVYGAVLIVMSSVSVFIIGAITGWLYGKIKNRK